MSNAEFDPKQLHRSTIALPLLERLATPIAHPVIIDVNLDYRSGRGDAKQWILDTLATLMGPTEKVLARTQAVAQYVFAELTPPTIEALVRRDAIDANGALEPLNDLAIYRIWPDFEIAAHTCASIATVKANAAYNAFRSAGNGIVWAVLDSGIDRHPHFEKYQNLAVPEPLDHASFVDGEAPLVDGFGHGTHVAGIVAGQSAASQVEAYTYERDEKGEARFRCREVPTLSGMAPEAKLLSLKILGANGKGSTSGVIAALAKIHEWNGYGTKIRVHGVNLSVGYDFDAKWFACGQSPLCVEVDRLVKSGVVVVAAAGNTGYGALGSDARDTRGGIALTINDPGNADRAITVGSTHRDMPHVYGVSYFSSKGPTGDGRLKPDLVAPGEKILSCAAGAKRAKVEAQVGAGKVHYLEDSGTSMAAPHVSGVIAAFLSVRREFIGRPDTVKEIFLASATDLKRERYFQGHGLVDLMRAIQSV